MTLEKRNILIVDDEEFIRSNLSRILSEENHNVILKEDGSSALEILNTQKIDLVLLDINLPDINGLEVLQKIKINYPDLLVIVMTGYASIESAVQSLKLGAYDYIKKPFKADAIKLITKLALETLSLKEKVAELQKQQSGITGIDEILGQSEKIKLIKHQIREFAKYDSETVLITGESGTGKQLIASSIHSLSPRSEKEFIEINCASIPETLLESELFGFEKGAFTDATKTKSGLFEKADGGSLFLDEIGEMTLTLQAKLLRVIEDKKFRRLGSVQDRTVNVRIIAATNRDLHKAIELKEFRNDLYHRLNVLRIEAPPLHEREDDILILANFFLNYYSNKFGKKISGFSEKVKEVLFQYNWPGNVRELKNFIERISILQTDETIKIEHLKNELFSKYFEKSKTNYASIHFGETSYDEMIGNFEKEILNKAYKQSDFNTSKTARLLKIPRETLRYKLERFKISNGGN